MAISGSLNFLSSSMTGSQHIRMNFVGMNTIIVQDIHATSSLDRYDKVPDDVAEGQYGFDLLSYTADNTQLQDLDSGANVLNHILVPHHELVPVEDEESSLAPWDMMVNNADGSKRLAKELLPKILITDPAIQAIKESVEVENDDLPAGWLTNRIVRIVRYSRSAGSSTAFRLIVESA